MRARFVRWLETAPVLTIWVSFTVGLFTAYALWGR